MTQPHPAPELTLTKLFWTDAMPDKYVAQASDGSLWIMHSSTFGPEAFRESTPYHGNYELHRTFPADLHTRYQE